jgi:hypothetical protein
MQLVERAGLNRISADGLGPDLGEQYRRLRAAAHTFELAHALPVAAYPCTYPLPCPAFLIGPGTETVPNMGVITLPCEMSGDAGSCCRDPLQALR